MLLDARHTADPALADGGRHGFWLVSPSLAATDTAAAPSPKSLKKFRRV
jgi:hypothetical protein